MSSKRTFGVGVLPDRTVGADDWSCAEFCFSLIRIGHRVMSYYVDRKSGTVNALKESRIPGFGIEKAQCCWTNGGHREARGQQRQK